MGGFGAQPRCDEALAHQEVDLAGVFLEEGFGSAAVLLNR